MELILNGILTAPQFHICQSPTAGAFTNSPTHGAAEENDGVDSRAWMANPR